MRRYIPFFLFTVFLGCKFPVPEALTTKGCTTGFIINTVDPTNPRKFNFTLNNSADVKYPITWKNNQGATLGSSNGNTFSFTFPADGNYIVNAFYQTICGDNLSINTNNLIINTQLIGERSISLTDPNVHFSLNVMAVSNNGDVFTNENNDILVWKNNIQTKERTIKGHLGNGIITNLVLSTDDKFLFSTSNSDTDIIVWDWKLGTQIRKLTGNQSSFNSIYITSDNKYIIGGSTSKQIKIWRVDNGTLVRSFTFSNPILSIAMTNEDKFIAIKTQNSNGSTSFALLDANNGAELWSLQNGYIGSMAINSIGTEIWLSGTRSNTNRPYLEVYNISERRLIKTFDEYFSGNDYPNVIKISPKNDFLQAGMNIFDTQSKSWVRNNNNHYFYAVDFCSISSDNKFILTGSSSGSVALAPFSTGLKLNSSLQKHPMKLLHGLISKDEKKIITQDFAGIKEFDFSTGAARNIINLNGTYNIALMTDGIWHRSCGLNKISYTNGSQLAFSNINYCNYNFSPITISKNENFLATQSTDIGTISVFDPSNGIFLRSLNGHSNSLIYLKYTEENNYLISAGLDNKINIWDAVNGNLIKQILILGQLNSVEINPDNKSITVSEGQSLRKYSIPDGSQINTLPITRSFNKLAVSISSTLLAGALGSNLYLYDNNTGILKKEKSFSTPILNISFNAAGTQIFVITQKEFEVFTVL